MRLLRYSRLIDEINEDQLDDQMDDEGSGSDSENSEVQGSTATLLGVSIILISLVCQFMSMNPG